MFNFFNKKKINTNQVKGFNRATSTIKSFIYIEEWENAYKAINEIKEKEKAAYEELITKISNSDKIDLIEKEKQTKTYNNKIKYLKKLENFTHKKEDNFIEKFDKKRFKIRFEQIK